MKRGIQLVRLQERHVYGLRGIGPGCERKIMNAFSNHKLLFALSIICLLAIPKLCLADDDHDWNASASFRTTTEETGPPYNEIYYEIIVTLSWEPPPRPRYSTGLHYLLYLKAGRMNVISWGNTEGSFRRLQGYCKSYAQFDAIVDNILSTPHPFTIVLQYSIFGERYEMSHAFTWYPPPLEATEPDPANGTAVILPLEMPLELNWSLGRKASTHDVYFSDNFQDVNEGTEDAFLGNLHLFPIVGIPESDYPNDLIPGKTYYWRIDGVDEDGTKFKGDIWCFWTKPPISITDPNLVCWWTFDLCEGLHVIDWSGHDHDGTIGGEPQWLDGYDGRALRFINEGDFVACSLDRASDWPAGTVVFWVRADTLSQDAWSGVFSSYFASSSGFQIDVDGGNPGNYQVDPGGLTFGAVATDWIHLALTFESSLAKLYYNGSWIESGTLEDTKFNQFALGINRNTVNSFFGIFDDLQIYDYALTQDKIKQVMRVKLLVAWEPGPANGSVPDIEHATPLVWSPGDGASQHDIYFGINHSSMIDANTSDTSGIYRGRQDPVVYTPTEALESGQAYYWRIDEINGLNDNAPRKGDIWSFTIQPDIAYRPYPSNGCNLRQQNVTLSWMPGSAGALHDVYFGIDLDDVNNANTLDNIGIYRGRWLDVSFATEQLVCGQTYYWRIDEVEADGTTIHKGNVWNFTVSDQDTVEYQVASSEDDGYASSDQLQNLSGDYLRAGLSSFGGPPYYMSGMVFRNVNIPKGTEIISAHLKIQSYNSRLTDTVYSRIQAEAADDTVGFDAFRSIGTLPKTSASVDWNHSEPWLENTWYESPNLAGVIQEVINRDGWQPNNSLTILYSTGDREGSYRNISSFDRGSDYAPILEITYIP